MIHHRSGMHLGPVALVGDHLVYESDPCSAHRALGYASGWRAARHGFTGELPTDASGAFQRAWEHGVDDAHYEEWLEDRIWREGMEQEARDE